MRLQAESDTLDAVGGMSVGQPPEGWTCGGVGTVSRPRGQTRPLGIADSATISVTCVMDGRCHSVPDEELAIGIAHRGGQYSAVCGHVVTPAPMVAPDGDLCPHCAERDSSHRSRRGFRLRL
ncbi:hypothetical protein GCM10009559_62060 [Pseudonocardia zijingensis]|uniref:Uncharacterized protein n=1 Tax=Pseudonocardia zijingensis TaxID=153376 RepID=A0ABP3YPP8_9PSEU